MGRAPTGCGVKVTGYSDFDGWRVFAAEPPGPCGSMLFAAAFPTPDALRSIFVKSELRSRVRKPLGPTHSRKRIGWERVMKKRVLAFAAAVGLVLTSSAFGGEPGWEGGIVRFGAERTKIRNMDILDRPYRLFHFYGNTVRRLHYRGHILPSLSDVSTVLWTPSLIP